MRILVVEDSDSIRRMIEALVAGRGHQVTTATNGTRGIELAIEEVPDVILLDLTMSGAIDGFGVCERIRKEPLTRAIPIVVISALDDEESKANARAAGATSYYVKPFSPLALLKEIDSFRTRQVSKPDQ